MSPLPRIARPPLSLLVSWSAFFLVLVSVFLLDTALGGNAISGKIESGRFYVGGNQGYKEVSRLLYLLSSVFILLAILLLYVGLVRLKRFVEESGLAKLPKVRYGLDKIALALLFGFPLVAVLGCIVDAILQ